MLRRMETPSAMFKTLCKEIETEFIRAKLDYEEKAREWQRKIMEPWDMRYLKNYYYKIRHNETNLDMFYDKLSYLINTIINEKYTAWLEKAGIIDTIGTRIFCFRKWINDQCLDSKNKRKWRKSFYPAGVLLITRETNLRREEKENFIRKRVLTSKWMNMKKVIMKKLVTWWKVV